MRTKNAWGKGCRLCSAHLAKAAVARHVVRYRLELFSARLESTLTYRGFLLPVLRLRGTEFLPNNKTAMERRGYTQRGGLLLDAPRSKAESSVEQPRRGL